MSLTKPEEEPRRAVPQIDRVSIPNVEFNELHRRVAELEKFLDENPRIAIDYCRWKLAKMIDWANEPTAGPLGPKLVSEANAILEMLPKNDYITVRH